MSTTRKRVYGYLAEFGSASALYKAAEKVRDAGYRKWDCHTPYPVHGLDAAMGMKRSILPWFVFFGGMLGTFTGFFLASATQTEIWGWLPGMNNAVESYPTVVQATALDHPSSFGSAGRRGLDRNPAPADPIGITGAAMAPIGR